MVRFDDDGDGDGRRRLERGAACAACRSATRCAIDGDTAAARDLPHRRAGARGRLRRRSTARSRATLRGLGFRLARSRAPIFLGGRLWGAVIVSSVEPEPFPPGAEQRIADFAELAAQALANAAGARGARRVARPHRRRRATPSAGGSSATCTTARSSGSSRWR